MDDGVAFAGRHFQFFAVENIDCGAAVLNGFVLLKDAGGQSDTGTIRAEHGGEKIVRKWEAAGADAVVGHEEPARESLLHFVEAIAGGGLRDLHTLEDGVAVEAHLKLGSGLEGGLKGLSSDAEAVALDLYDDAKRASVQTDGEGSANSAFATYDAGLDCSSSAHGDDDRSQAAIEEMNEMLLSVRLVEAQVARQVEELEMRKD